jgi:hypothetical protein
LLLLLDGFNVGRALVGFRVKLLINSVYEELTDCFTYPKSPFQGKGEGFGAMIYGVVQLGLKEQVLGLKV